MSTVKDLPSFSKRVTKTSPSRVGAGRSSRGIADRLSVSLFESEIGWTALIGRGDTVHQVRLGFPTQASLLGHLRSEFVGEFDVAEWQPRLVGRLKRYFSGARDDFRDVPVHVGRPTAFQTDVIRACRAIPPGQTMSYGEVAAAIGHPGAARAVGTVMAKNPVPILIPCHRVVGAQGSLGGYSGRGGLKLKRWLLDLESRG
jgi:methylated-DNA-[protein]-cysteine S-methyltransferase